MSQGGSQPQGVPKRQAPTGRTREVCRHRCEDQDVGCHPTADTPAPGRTAPASLGRGAALAARVVAFPARDRVARSFRCSCGEYCCLANTTAAWHTLGWKARRRQLPRRAVDIRVGRVLIYTQPPFPHLSVDVQHHAVKRFTRVRLGRARATRPSRLHATWQSDIMFVCG